MAIMNYVSLIGNLGADAELRMTGNGQPVLNFRLATTEKFKKKDGEKQEHTEWHSITLWGPRAEALSSHLTKGTRIAITGKLRTREYEDREGNKRKSTEIHLDDLEFLGDRGADNKPNVNTNDARQSKAPPKSKPKWAQDVGAPNDDFPGEY